MNINYKRTAEEAIKFIANEVNPDILIWTGDNNNHVLINFVIDFRLFGPKLLVIILFRCKWLLIGLSNICPKQHLFILFGIMIFFINNNDLRGNHEDFPVSNNYLFFSFSLQMIMMFMEMLVIF